MLKILNRNELTNEIAVVVGTRPGIIKFSPVVRALRQNNVPFFIIHTGQHYSYNMDRKFFEDLSLPEPRYTNDIVCKEVYHGAQTAEMLKGIEKALLDSKPSIVIVGGDANTNLAGALAARKLGLCLAHMEAGLRSHDWRMPEEHNRIMIDHISDVLFPPTEQAKKNLIDDNVKADIYVVGNPIVDAVYQNIKIAEEKSSVLSRLSVDKKYFLLTIHREENVDHEKILKELIENIGSVIREFKTPVVFPIHPRTKNRLKQYKLWEWTKSINKLRIIDALGYIDFLLLIKKASLILTDSGGIQEEACILNIPCVTLRENTERPETVHVGANQIVGYNLELTLRAIKDYLKNPRSWQNPFGDGKSAQRIVKTLKKYLRS
ncbi:UDP-N-acetylglucosamine 2-epimerase [candidate division WOR-1 bacterium DG_54_3]|uniref:UDP-N-acetylglucosamine 2-epimerase n=1 Tax=candidate division WOR-1 bacterium DG_54_3 TaxID=1703775 RepID=A0A0S7XSV4_UNCSA|nr:MAG: UDP-N-acetylglucosamine 2-epimerase [candidate division WOR-1 bacterium DG_54_3]